MPDEPIYSSIRQVIGGLIGQHIVDITERERVEGDPEPESYVMLHFSSGTCLRFSTEDGFGVINSGGEVPRA